MLSMTSQLLEKITEALIPTLQAYDKTEITGVSMAFLNCKLSLSDIKEENSPLI